MLPSWKDLADCLSLPSLGATVISSNSYPTSTLSTCALCLPTESAWSIASMQLSFSISILNISIYNHYQQNDLQHQQSWSATVLEQDFHFDSIKSWHNSQETHKERKDILVVRSLAKTWESDLRSASSCSRSPPRTGRLVRACGETLSGGNVERGTGGTKTNTGPKHLPYRATLTGAVAPTSKKLLAPRPHAGQKPLLSTGMILLSY